MTRQRRRMWPVVVLLAAAMGLVYASAGVDVDGGSELVAAGDEPPALTVVNRIALPAQAVPDSATSGPVPSDLEPEDVADVAAISPDDNVGEAKTADEKTADDVYPVRIQIPAISVDAAVVDLGLNQDGTLEVPTDFDVTGWYTGRSVPGDNGPSVVVGHVDSHTGPAVFIELRRLETGDLVRIDRSDGLVAWFQIRELTQVDKDEFPTQQVYGDTAEPTLRLITCGGDFDRSERSYRDNLIVFAEHLGNSTPAAALSVLSPGQGGLTQDMVGRHGMTGSLVSPATFRVNRARFVESVLDDARTRKELEALLGDSKNSMRMMLENSHLIIQLRDALVRRDVLSAADIRHIIGETDERRHTDDELPVDLRAAGERPP